MRERDQSRITVLAFEGPDKSGKSTLIKEINKVANFRFLCIDRFMGSAWVYDRLTGRRERTDSLIRAEEELSKLGGLTVLNILLRCTPGVLRERIGNKDECGELRVQQLSIAISLYDEYARKITRLPTIEVDTSCKTVEETVQEILTKVGEYEQNNC